MIKNIIVFLEDPGAVTYYIPLHDYLLDNHFEVSIYTMGLASNLLDEQLVKHTKIESTDVEASEVISNENSLLLVGTSENLDSFSFKLIHVAKQLKVPSVGVIDSGANYKSRYRGRTSNCLSHVPDYLFVPDKITKTKYCSLGVKEKNIFVCGYPYYDYVSKAKKRLLKEGRKNICERLLPNYDGKKDIFIFLSELNEGIKDESEYKVSSAYTMHGSGNSFYRTDIIIEEIIEIIKDLKPRPYMILRLHPKTNLLQFEKYTKQFDFISKKEHPYEVIFISDLVLGMTTNLLIESVIMGKRVLSVLPRIKEQEWLFGLNEGIIDTVCDRENLRRKIEAYKSEVKISSDFLENYIPINSKKIVKDALMNII